MKYIAVCRLLLPLLACLLCLPALATDNYTYKPHEYATIWQGKSPNHRFSIAAHGDGEDGYDNFHVYLMAEPGHRKIGILEEIKDILDTGPEAFCALWSPDSRYVAILNRSDRHVLQIKLYLVANRRAYPVAIPDICDTVARQHGLHAGPYDNAESLYAYFQMHWIGNNRFELTQTEGGRIKEATFTNAVKDFTRSQKEAPANGEGTTYWTEFSGKATLSIEANNKANILTVKPDKFDQTVDLSPSLAIDHGVLKSWRTTLRTR